MASLSMLYFLVPVNAFVIPKLTYTSLAKYRPPVWNWRFPLNFSVPKH